MNQFSKEIQDSVNAHAVKALEVCAMEFNRLTDKFTPVWTGNLQRSKHVVTEGKDVFAVTGSQSTQKYINKQYYLPLRHRGNFQSGLLDLTALHRDSATVTSTHTRTTKSGKPSRAIKRTAGQRKVGRGKTILYSRAYRLAVKNGEIQKMDKSEWYERGARDPEIMQIMGEVFVNYL